MTVDVSVIIPCFNMERYLPETLQSIQFQTNSAWEAIFVDDGSVDGSGLVAKRFAERDGRFKTVCHTENLGLSAARNTGIALSKGEFILPLDADDLLEPTAIEAMLAESLRQPNRIIYSDVFLIPDIGAEGRRVIFECPDYDFRELLKKVLMFPTSMFPREAWVESGGFKDIGEGFEDWEFWVTLGELGYEGHRIPKPLYSYRVKREGSMRQDAIEVRDKLIKKIQGLHPVSYGLEEVELGGCCGNKISKGKKYEQVEPSGETVLMQYTGGAGPHSLEGPKTKTNYLMHPNKPTTVYVEDADILIQSFPKDFKLI